MTNKRSPASYVPEDLATEWQETLGNVMDTLDITAQKMADLGGYKRGQVFSSMRTGKGRKITILQYLAYIRIMEDLITEAEDYHFHPELIKRLRTDVDRLNRHYYIWRRSLWN